MAAPDAAVVLSIGEMIDLAISTPETGVVDFGMLHTVLHCLAQQMHVQNKTVELRGEKSTLPTKRDLPQTIAITEYLMDTDERPDGATTVPPGAALKVSTQPEGAQAGGGRAPSTAPDSILIVKRLTKPEAAEHQQQPTSASQEERRKLLSQGKAASIHSHKADIASAQLTPSTEKLSLVTVSKFNILENIVEDLRDRVYGSMPKNEDILEEVRSQTNMKAITDMWTSLNVSSRLEAAEAGIAKLSSLVQDFISDTGDVQDAYGEYGSRFEPTGPDALYEAEYETAEQTQGTMTQDTGEVGAADETGAPKTGQAQTTGATQQAGARRAPHQTAAGPPKQLTPGAEPHVVAKHSPTGRPIHRTIHKPLPKELVTVIEVVRHLHEDVGKLKDDFYNAMADLKPEIERPERPPTPELPQTPTPGAVAGQEEIGEQGTTAAKVTGQTADKTTAATQGATQATTDKRESPTAKVTATREPSTTDGGESDTGEASAIEGATGKTEKRVVLGAGKSVSLSDISKRLCTVERKLKECCESVNKQDGVVHDHLNSFQDQLEYISRQVASTQEFTGTKMSQDVAKDLPGLMKLFQTVQLMQEELKQVHETALQLAAEKEDRQDRINSIIEQIEVLKAVKLDREDMAEAMAEKADMRMLARKVSHDQFELACDDLSRGLDHALGKLNLQEALWQQALDDIQREIETKLDKMELSPVKEFFNNKLKQLQENLKQIASLRQEVEAAGAKKKLMRDLNCLSCDAKVAMQVEAETTIPVSKPLPANLSMKPYLSYELDTIRKTQASNIPQRNLHDWEHIDKQAQPLKTPQKVRSEADKHLCNRYCGGSHTMTTPAQRVARLGHFVKQWGPDVLPLSSGYATGEDGRMYKISPPEGQEAVTGGSIEAPCTPFVPFKKGDFPKIPEKRTAPAECRCLEEGGKPAYTK